MKVKTIVNLHNVEFKIDTVSVFMNKSCIELPEFEGNTASNLESNICHYFTAILDKTNIPSTSNSGLLNVPVNNFLNSDIYDCYMPIYKSNKYPINGKDKSYVEVFCEKVKE